MSIEKVLRGGGVQGNKADLFKALSKALLRSVQDKVANVFHGTLQVIPGSQHAEFVDVSRQQFSVFWTHHHAA